MIKEEAYTLLRKYLGDENCDLKEDRDYKTFMSLGKLLFEDVAQVRRSVESIKKHIDENGMF